MKLFLRFFSPITVVVALCIGTFVFFRLFFVHNPSTLTIEILAAILGTILTVTITAMMIKRQGEVSNAYKQAAVHKTKVFEKKLELYHEFIDFYAKANIDGILEQEELATLEYFSLRIFLFTNHDVCCLGEKICQFVYQLQLLREPLNEQNEKQKEELLRKLQETPKLSEVQKLVSFSDVLKAMRQDLGIFQKEKIGNAYPCLEALIKYRNYRV